MSFTSSHRAFPDRDRMRPALDAPSPGAAAWKAHATAAIVHATLEALLETAPAVTDPLAAELLGSDACGVWWSPADESELSTADGELRIGRAYAAHLEELGGPRALAALRALQLGGSDGVVAPVAEAAARLSASGVEEPSWWRDAERIEIRRGARISWSGEGHDYTSLLLEVDRAGELVTLAVATVDDCSGVVGDVLLFSDLDGFGQVVRAPGRRLEWVGVGATRRAIRRAIDRTDLLGTGDPPGHADPEIGYVALRGLAQRWSAAG